MTKIKLISAHKCFDGIQSIYSHFSQATHCEMRFGLFLPPQKERLKFSVLYWLSGLTGTEENFIDKAGAQRMTSELGVIIVTPDTSPRGLGLPGENDSDDFGLGASFYVDAITPIWKEGYKMYTYITQELTALVNANFPVALNQVGIFGHSMGGHGALMIALKNPQCYKSVSAFAPISSPMHSPWGVKAFTGYLGSDWKKWQDYDATALISTRGWQGPPLLVDQGTKDQFLEQQLKPELLRQACAQAGVNLNLRMQAGYDHSYFFIATFIEDHLRFHAQNLKLIKE